MTTCPICNSNNARINLCKVSFTYQSEFDLSECPDCGVIYFNPIPTKEQFVNFYSSLGYDFNRWREEIKGNNYIKRLEKIKKQGRFLDLGCASAYFINKIDKDSDWEVYGVELSQKPVEFARNVLGLKNITHGDLFDANYADNFFDCIHISDVLEHVPNPLQILTECKRILKDDGYIFLNVPNGYSDSRGMIRYYKDFNEKSGHSSGHVFFFPPQTLKYMFERTGLEIDKCTSFGIKRGLRNMGLLPMKSNWSIKYQPRREKEIPYGKDIKLVTERRHTNFYYWLRYYKRNLFQIPGLHKFGLNFNFILRCKRE